MTKKQHCKAIERQHPGMTVCRRCMHLFTASELSANKQTPYCRPCFNFMNYEWRKKNKDKVFQSKRRYLSSVKGIMARRAYRRNRPKTDIVRERNDRALERYHITKAHEPCVYLIGEPHGDGPVKIGVTTDPARRLRQLQTGSPVTLSVLATIPFPDKPSAHAFEHDMHRKMRPLHGEWFSRGDAFACLPQKNN